MFVCTYLINSTYPKQPFDCTIVTKWNICNCLTANWQKKHTYTAVDNEIIANVFGMKHGHKPDPLPQLVE